MDRADKTFLIVLVLFPVLLATALIAVAREPIELGETDLAALPVVENIDLVLALVTDVSPTPTVLVQARDTPAVPSVAAAVVEATETPTAPSLEAVALNAAASADAPSVAAARLEAIPTDAPSSIPTVALTTADTEEVAAIGAVEVAATDSASVPSVESVVLEVTPALDAPVAPQAALATVSLASAPDVAPVALSLSAASRAWQTEIAVSLNYEGQLHPVSWLGDRVWQLTERLKLEGWTAANIAEVEAIRLALAQQLERNRLLSKSPE